MSEKNIRFYTQYDMAFDSYAINLVELDFNNKISSIANNITFKEYKRGVSGEPFLRVYDDQAQQLLQTLWDAGIRPKQVGTAGHLDAVKYHLEDMRKIVFVNSLPHKPEEA